MITPALDALLKNVEENARVAATAWQGDAMCATSSNGGKAPRLAAMLRVAVEALDGMPDADTLWDVLNVRAAALARIEAMAKGEE